MHAPKYPADLGSLQHTARLHPDDIPRLVEFNRAAEAADARVTLASGHRTTTDEITAALVRELKGALASALPTQQPWEIARQLAGHKLGLEEFAPIIAGLKTEADAANADLQVFITANPNIPPHLIYRR